jgi:hypothetical protein
MIKRKCGQDASSLAQRALFDKASFAIGWLGDLNCALLVWIIDYVVENALRFVAANDLYVIPGYSYPLCNLPKLIYTNSLDQFSDDFMETRDQPEQQAR